MARISARPTAASAAATAIEKMTKMSPVSDFRVRPEPPERDEVEIRSVQHQLNPGQHEDRAAPRQRAGQSDREQQSGNEQTISEGSHQARNPCFCAAPESAPGSWRFSRSARITAPIIAAVSISAITSRGRT